MPTTLGKPYSPTWTGSPPHMLQEDIPIWHTFLNKYGSLFISVYYDVLLGGPFLTKDQENDPMWRMWKYNTSKRIDALAELASEIWIIEVASTPGLRALGQLLTYRSLWIEDPKIAKPEKVSLVCEQIDHDLIASAARYGVSTYIIRPPFVS